MITKEFTFELVEELFTGKKDKGGKDYINHLIRVASKFKNNDEIMVALLHDVLEDTDITKDELVEIGYGSNIVESVHILTRNKKTTYKEYIEQIINSGNILAMKVKKADLEDNMNIDRIPNATQRDIDMIKTRYAPAHIQICKTIEEMTK